jgi:hypothetical protein
VDLKPGMFLYDVADKSISILIRRFWSYEGREPPPYIYQEYEPEFFKVWVWETVSSKDGKTYWSETGLINLIKADIIIILDNN